MAPVCALTNTRVSHLQRKEHSVELIGLTDAGGTVTTGVPEERTVDEGGVLGGRPLRRAL